MLNRKDPGNILVFAIIGFLIFTYANISSYFETKALGNLVFCGTVKSIRKIPNSHGINEILIELKNGKEKTIKSNWIYDNALKSIKIGDFIIKEKGDYILIEDRKIKFAPSNYFEPHKTIGFLLFPFILTIIGIPILERKIYWAFILQNASKQIIKDRLLKNILTIDGIYILINILLFVCSFIYKELVILICIFNIGYIVWILIRYFLIEHKYRILDINTLKQNVDNLSWKEIKNGFNENTKEGAL